MASPFSSQNTNKNIETSSSSSSLPPLPPSDTFLSADHFSNQCNQNYDSGFRTAPSSPPPEPAAPPPDTSSFPFPADASPQSGSVTGVSSPPSPETTKSSGPLPAVLHGRDALPSHHLLKIKPFSTLSKAPMEKFSSEFEAGGYKWNFSIYPTGDKTKDGQDHISVYLEIVETSTLPPGWEVNAMFNIFVFDQIRDKYVGPQDATVRRFHCMKTQWGVVKFIDLETFNNPYNGYLVNDTCSFGVEVFVVKSTSKAECLSLIHKPETYKAAWSFPNISKVTSKWETEFFVGGDYKWRVLFYPKGYQPEGNKINNIVSLYLNVDTSTLPAGTKLLVHYTFRMEDKKKGNHFKRSDSKLFSSAARGFREFMSLTKFKDPENGFLVGDTCLIEAEVQVLGLVTLE